MTFSCEHGRWRKELKAGFLIHLPLICCVTTNSPLTFSFSSLTQGILVFGWTEHSWNVLVPLEGCFPCRMWMAPSGRLADWSHPSSDCPGFFGAGGSFRGSNWLGAGA